jgi:mono/diheme cytochrome c family protein
VAAEDPASLMPNAARGMAVYRASCASCHGAAGQGGSAPALAGLSARYSQAQTIAFIVSPPAGMPKLYPGNLGAQDVADVAAYVRTSPLK